jgi:hypothetical protein
MVTTRLGKSQGLPVDASQAAPMKAPADRVVLAAQPTVSVTVGDWLAEGLMLEVRDGVRVALIVGVSEAVAVKLALRLGETVMLGVALGLPSQVVTTSK